MLDTFSPGATVRLILFKIGGEPGSCCTLTFSNSIFPFLCHSGGIGPEMYQLITIVVGR